MLARAFPMEAEYRDTHNPNRVENVIEDKFFLIFLRAREGEKMPQSGIDIDDRCVRSCTLESVVGTSDEMTC